MDDTVTKFDVTSITRKNVLMMTPYSSARDEFQGEAEVYLDANENPYPTPYNRYPDPLQWRVKEKIGRLKSVDPEMIFLGNGSDEAIDLLIRAFCEPHKESILITEPTYGMYSVCANVNAVNIQKVSLTDQYDLDAKALTSRCDATTKIIFLCSPNNPTSNLLDRKKIIQVLDHFNGIVVIDEAYIDFTKEESFIAELVNYPNLAILQTFSKAWGLAGLRLGMCFASVEIIKVLNKIKYPYNVNIKTQELALIALDNVSQKDAWVNEIINEREKLRQALTGLSITQTVYPSEANFVLVKVNDARKIYDNLMKDKIVVRDRSKVILCDNCLRITIGTPQENKRLIEALNKL